jgi:excisionase family DNA binding protein
MDRKMGHHAMTGLSLREAAKQVHVSKSTILRAIRSGRMSSARTEDGGYSIDPAELFRVYQPKSNDNGAHSPERDGTHRELEAQVAGLKEVRDVLLAQLEDCKRDRDAWRSQAEAVARLTYQPQKRRWWQRAVS